MTPDEIILSRKDGHLYNAMSLKAGDMPIEHIAHNLSYINRYNGAQPCSLSVALHSLLVARMVPAIHRYEALMHDASEAIVGDLAHPIKAMCPEFRAIEARVQEQLARIFELPPHECAAVRAADIRSRDIECYVLRGTEPRFAFTDREKVFCDYLRMDLVCSPEVVAYTFLITYDEVRADILALH